MNLSFAFGSRAVASIRCAAAVLALALGRFSAGSLRPAQSVHEGCSPNTRAFSQPPTTGRAAALRSRQLRRRDGGGRSPAASSPALLTPLPAGAARSLRRRRCVASTTRGRSLAQGAGRWVEGRCSSSCESRSWGAARRPGERRRRVEAREVRGGAAVALGGNRGRRAAMATSTLGPGRCGCVASDARHTPARSLGVATPRLIPRGERAPGECQAPPCERGSRRWRDQRV